MHFTIDSVDFNVASISAVVIIMLISRRSRNIIKRLNSHILSAKWVRF